MFLLACDCFTQIQFEVVQLFYSAVMFQKSCCIVEIGTVREPVAPFLFMRFIVNW